jgi:proteasome lid subunit RPN8/RPN11
MSEQPRRIYPVYILSRAAEEIFQKCRQAEPKETLGRLVGYRCTWEGIDYIKITDWVTGHLDSGNTYARFTPQGIRECEFFLDERYGDKENRPVEVGLFHSHPFNTDPYFSMVDQETFLTFPYDQAGNVFVLIDPLADFFKVFIIAHRDGEKYLQQVNWICYNPRLC